MNECRSGLEPAHVLVQSPAADQKNTSRYKLNSDQRTADFGEEQTSVTHTLSRLSPWTPVSMVTTLGVYREDKEETWT